MNNSVAREMGVDPFPLFGFNQAEGIVDEPIRAIQNAGESFFTDGVHTRAVLGKQIMEAVWEGREKFGAELTTDSIDEYLADVERLRLGFDAANSKLTATLRSAVSPELE